MAPTFVSCCCVCVMGVGALGQTLPPDPTDWSDPGAVVEYYKAFAEVEPTEIVLLGTFHFDDQGLDAYKPQHGFDAASPERAAEIESVVDRLEAFGPDVVCVERKPRAQAGVDERYAAYRAGELAASKNETVLVGFELADRLGHERVFGVDAPGAWLEPRVDVEAYAKEHGQADRLRTAYDLPVYAYLGARDRFIDRTPLDEILVFMNDEDVLDVSHAGYLVGRFDVGEGEAYPGADGFVTHWYNRNLRIFQSIKRVSEPGQRVVVVIGAGHVPILKHLVETSPEFELVEVGEVLGGEQ